MQGRLKKRTDKYFNPAADIITMGTEEDREALISKLMGEGYLRTEKVIQAFREVPREEFVSPGDRMYAYADYPLEIGHGRRYPPPTW